MGNEIPKWAVNLCSKAGVETDLIIWDDILTSDLTHNEKKSKLLEQLRPLAGSKLIELEANIKQAEIDDQQANLDYLKRLQDAQNEQLALLKAKNADTERFFKECKQLVDMTITGKNTALLISGRGGLGKSNLVLSSCAEHNLVEGVDFVQLNTYVTPLEFYNFLFEHREKLIIIDDAMGVLDNPKSLSLLKGALWSVTQNRIVSYHTTSKLRTAPEQFMTNSRFIICQNSHLGNDIHTKALLSRLIHYRLDFEYDQIIEILFEIAKKDHNGLSLDERYLVADYIKNTSNLATDNLNIRSLLKAFDLYSNCKDNWQDLVRKTLLYTTFEKQVLYDLCNSNMPITMQIKKFKEKTGYGISKFYALKREVGL